MKRKKKRKTAKFLRALRVHRDGLKKMRVHRPPARDGEAWRREYAAGLREGVGPPLSGELRGDPDSTADRSLRERMRGEPEHVTREIDRRAAQVAPLYNWKDL